MNQLNNKTMDQYIHYWGINAAVISSVLNEFTREKCIEKRQRDEVFIKPMNQLSNESMFQRIDLKL